MYFTESAICDLTGIGDQVTTLGQILIAPSALAAPPTTRILTSHKDEENRLPSFDLKAEGVLLHVTLKIG